jgi:hypothetical protein
VSEKQIQDRIRAKLLSRGVPTQKMWGSALQSGVPDLFCGSFWIEVKAPGGKLRPSQVDWCEKFHLQGARVYVCDDPDKLWSILGSPPNWRDYCPKVSHKAKLSVALREFQD